VSFVVYPAIDLREGRVVRLRQGDYGRETRYADDALAVAERYASAGARWLHLVDLDAARLGGYTLAPLLAAIRRSTPLRVQTGGGVRSERDVETMLDAGAERVVVGSLAVRDPARVARWLRHYGPERLTIALDVRRVAGCWRLPVAGWTEDSGIAFEALLRRHAEAGARHLLCTDIGRDGMLSGPNLELYRTIRALAPDVALQASGGIRDIGDILAARGEGCAGAVLGRGLLEGRFALDDALREVA